MTERNTLAGALTRIAWGNILLLLDINLGTLDILPNWLGVLLILGALPVLAREEPTAALLRPLGILMAVWEGTVWCVKLFGGTVNLPLLTVLAGVVSIYFHFQLLTDLSSIARRYACPQEQSLLRLRTVRTVLLAVMTLPLSWGQIPVLTVVLLVILLVVAVWIARTLFAMKGSLLEPETLPS